MKNTLYRSITITCAFSLGTSMGLLAQTSSTYRSETTPSTQGDDSHDSPLSRQGRAAGKGSLSAGDKAFAMEAAKGGMMEVAMGKMAENHASDGDVKKFGARMVTDHGTANAELKSIAGRKGITLPGEAKKGEKWHSDKEYVSMMVKDHEKDLAEFQKEAKEGSDPDIKKFAGDTSEVIKKHLEMVKDLESKMK